MLMFLEDLLYFKHCETHFSYINTFHPHNNATVTGGKNGG